MPVDPLLGADPNNPAVGPSMGNVGLPSTTPGSATVSRPQQGGAAGAPLRIAQDIMAFEQARRSSAMAQLQQNLQAREAGFPVDPHALVKLAKKAGLHFSTDPADVQAVIDQAHGQVPGPSQKPQAQAMGQAQPTAAVNAGKMTVQQQRQTAVEMWANNALQQAQARGESAQRMAELHDQVVRLKTDALSDDPQVRAKAVGKLMSINEIPFTLDRAEWENASPEQKKGMINMAAGGETEAQIQTRITNMANSYLSSGRFSDPEAAQKAASALAHGQAIPADVRAKMKPYTFSELADQAKLADELVALGVPPDRIGAVSEAAETGIIANALPAGISPVLLQQLQVQREQVGLESQRLGVEVARFQAEQQHYLEDSKRVDAAAQQAENKEFLEKYQAMVMAKKAGAPIPDEILREWNRQLAERSGLDVKEVNNWFHFLTGGTHDVFTARSADDVAGAAAGDSQLASSPQVQQKTAPPQGHMEDPTAAAQRGGLVGTLARSRKGSN